MTAVPVLHLISSLKIGGSERLLVSLMQASAGASETRPVVVIMNDVVDSGLLQELEDTGVPVYQLARKPGHMHPRYARMILKIADKHETRVVHTHNDGSRFWGMALKALRPSLKLVYSIHAQGIARELSGISLHLYRCLVDTTIAISPAIEQEARSIGISPVVRIENGIALARFESTPQIKDQHGPIRLVHIGRFASVKGQDILLEAMARLVAAKHVVHLTLAGIVGDIGYFEGLRQQILRLKLQDHVSMVLNRRDVETILAQADVFVLPSREEGFGLAIIEAMAAGLPVVVAKVGGAATIVEHAHNGLHFQTENVEDLASQIARLVNAPELCQALATAGRQTARRYDIRETERRLAALYMNLAPSSFLARAA